MMRTAITMLLGILYFHAQAQGVMAETKCEIRGTVQDESGQIVEGAVVVATNHLVGKIAGATVTNASGDFVLSISWCDSLAIEITHLLYEPYIINMADIPISSSIGTIVIKEKQESITEAVVTGNYIKRRGSSMIVSVKGNPNAKNKNALQFINTLPGVNGLYINGQSISKVFVNDRELKLEPDQLYRYVAGLKAEDVETIQVVSQKGAKYEAKHKGGIIRIQMSRSDIRKISGSLTVPVSVNTYDGAVSTNIPFMLNFMNDKLSSYTFVNAAYMQNENESIQHVFEDGEEWNIQNRTFAHLMLDQSLVYDFSKHHSIGFALNGSFKPIEKLNSTGESNNINDKTNFNAVNAALNYRWNIDDNGSNLVLAGDYLYRNDKFTNIYKSNSILETNTSDTDKNTYSITVDGEYCFPDEISSLSGGLFYLGMDAQEDYRQTNFSNRFNYKEAIYGAYIDFYSSFIDESLDLDLGFRYERTDINWKYKEDVKDRIGNTDKFNNFFPSASLSYSFPNGKHYMSLSYGRDISRPVMSDYDPAIYRDGNRLFSQGAIYLKPEFENSISLTHSINNMHTFELSYNWTRNIYDMIYKSDGDKLIVTDGNIGSSRKVEFYANTKFWIVKQWLYANLSGTFDYTGYISSEYGNVDTFNASVSASLSLLLPKAWAIGISGSYTSPKVTPVEKRSDIYSFNAAIGKTFNKRFSLSLTGMNLLYNQNMNITSRISGVHYKYLMHNNFRTITLNFTYNFGTSYFYAKQAKVNMDVVKRSTR